MARPQKYKALLDKSLAAAVSAIEIYNKPDFKYREETFGVLMVNAWELLLKAKILKDNRNVLNSIYIPARTRTANNATTRHFFPKKNRSGNPMTIDIYSALDQVSADQVLKANIELLVEIRDNAIHFFNKSGQIKKKILEVGIATLRSFVVVNKEWFSEDLSKYNFFLMPLSFFHPFEFESHSISRMEKQQKKLLSYIQQQEALHTVNTNSVYHLSLALETRFVKSTSGNAMAVRYDKDDPFAVAVKISEEDMIKTKYPLSYKALVNECRSRFANFLANPNFHQIKKELELEPECKYARKRFLDPGNPKSSRMTFYSTEVWKVLDTKYTKKL